MMPDKSIVDEVGPDSPGQIRWIDTRTMVCDPLTKATKPDRLRDMLASCTLDMTPTTQSVIAKQKKQKRYIPNSGIVGDESIYYIDSPFEEPAFVPSISLAFLTKRVTGVNYTCVYNASSHT